MADNDNGGGLTKLLLGGGAAWLIWQYFQTPGATGSAGCPPNAVQVRLSDGSLRCVPGSQIGGIGGLSIGQTISLVGGIVGTVIGIGVQVAAMIAKAGAGAGASAGVSGGVGTSAAATTAVTGSTTTVTTAAGAAGAVAVDSSIFAEEAAVSLITASEATSLGFIAGWIAIPYLLAETTSLLAQAIGGVTRNRNRADRASVTNFNDVLYNEQAAVTDFVSKMVDLLNSKIQDVSSKSGQAPVYPDLNNQQSNPKLNGFSGYGGRASSRGRGRGAGRGRRGFSGFGLTNTVAAPVSTRLVAKAPNATALTSQEQAFVAALAASAHVSSSTPYAVNWDLFTGGDPNNAQPTTCIGTGTYCNYLTSLDPRLPVLMLRDYRALMRWVFWTQERQYNSTMRQYWQNRMIDEGSIPECAGVSVALTCLNNLTVDDYQFDAALAAYYAGIPSSQLLPAAYQTSTTYPELNGTAYEYIQSLNQAAKAFGMPQIDFDALTKSLQFNGVAQAICAAAQIGFGTWTSTWPGDFQFTEMIRKACSLDAWSPATAINVIDRSYGPNPQPLWLIRDPVTGWFVDVVGSRQRATPQCYKFQPAGNYPVGPAPNAPSIPLPDEYVPLSGYGQSKRRRIFGHVVPLSPESRGGLMGVLAKGLSL